MGGNWSRLRKETGCGNEHVDTAKAPYPRVEGDRQTIVGVDLFGSQIDGLEKGRFGLLEVFQTDQRIAPVHICLRHPGSDPHRAVWFIS